MRFLLAGLWSRNKPGDELYYRKNYSEINELFYNHSEVLCGDNESYYVPETRECYRVFYCPESLRYRWRTFAWSTCAQSSSDTQWVASNVNCYNTYNGQLFDFLDSPDVKLRFAWWIAKKIGQEMADDGFMWSMVIGTRIDDSGMFIGSQGKALYPQSVKRPQSDFPTFRAYKPSPCRHGDICCLIWYPGIFENLGRKTILVARQSCDVHGGGTHLCQKRANFTDSQESDDFFYYNNDTQKQMHLDQQETSKKTGPAHHQKNYSLPFIFITVLITNCIIQR